MTGTDRNTGKPLSGRDHLFQSVADILTTPIGSRVERRTYGSECFQFVDQPLTPTKLAGLYAAVAAALAAWEPRLQVTQIAASVANAAGQLVVNVTGTYLPDGTQVQLTGIPITS